MHKLGVRCSLFLDESNEPRVESDRDFRISVSKREANARRTELSLTTREITGWDRASVGRIEPIAVLGRWLGKFRGVSKHHLQKYLGFLGLKLNSPNDWFEKLLCYDVSG